MLKIMGQRLTLRDMYYATWFDVFKGGGYDLT